MDHPAAAAPKSLAEPVYRVVSPLGEPTLKPITMAPRLDTLAGKTVGMVWNEAFNADITLPAIAEALKATYPDIKIIPYTEIGAALRAAGPDPEDPKAEMVALQAVLNERLRRADQRERRVRDLHPPRGPRGHRR